jgi:AcrR family transcriptional regulator
MGESSTDPRGSASGDASPVDPRAARTREAIFRGIERLVTARVSRVTVSDIVRSSGVSRSSFYVHFTSLDDLALAFLTRQIDIIGEAGIAVRRDDLITGVAAARIGYGRLVEHIVQHYPLYSSVLEASSSRGAFGAAIDAYARRLLRSVLDLDVAPPGTNTDVVVAYVAGGALTVISSWIRGDFAIDDDELVNELVDLLPDWVSRDHVEEGKVRLR